MLSIGIGSKTSTGGVVIEGNSGLEFDGLVASSIGHKATCPACKKGVGEIVAVGARTTFLPAGPAARAGDYVACGCPPGANTLVAQGTISIDGQNIKTFFRSNNFSQSEMPPAGKSAIEHIGESVTFARNAYPNSEAGSPSVFSLADTSYYETLPNHRSETLPSVQTAGGESNWRHIGSLGAGGGRVEKNLVLDAGQELKLQAYSDTLGLEGFYVDVTPWPLNELGELASTADALKVVVPPIGGFNGIYQMADDGSMKRSFTAGFGTGMSLEFRAPYENSDGFRWFIKIPPQEQLHQNSAGYRVDIYAR